jgi:hypothetical protein
VGQHDPTDPAFQADVAVMVARWDLAHGRLLVLARHDNSNSGLLDYWLVQSRQTTSYSIRRGSPSVQLRGRDELRRFGSGEGRPPRKPEERGQHWLTNIVLDGNAHRASLKAYLCYQWREDGQIEFHPPATRQQERPPGIELGVRP